MEFVAGIFFLGLAVTLVVGKGVLMSHEFVETEWERLNREKQAGEDRK